MSNELFPRTEVGGISLPRLICGTNWVAGWSHRSPAADAKLKKPTPIQVKFAKCWKYIFKTALTP